MYQDWILFKIEFLGWELCINCTALGAEMFVLGDGFTFSSHEAICDFDFNSLNTQIGFVKSILKGSADFLILTYRDNLKPVLWFIDIYLQKWFDKLFDRLKSFK